MSGERLDFLSLKKSSQFNINNLIPSYYTSRFIKASEYLNLQESFNNKLQNKLHKTMEVDDNHNNPNTNNKPTNNNHNKNNPNNVNITITNNNHNTKSSNNLQFPYYHPKIIKRNKTQTHQRYQRIIDERKANGYNRSDFKLTDNGDFYNKFVEEFNINSHIDPYIEYRNKEESHTRTTCYEGVKKPPRISISSGQLAIHGTDNDKIQEIIQQWMFIDQNFAFLIPGEYDIERMTSTKANIQCHDSSYFENNVNILELNNNIQDKLQIGAETATVTVHPRETVYVEFDAALHDLDNTIKSPKQIQEIVPKRIRQHWRNKLIYWFCNKIEQNEYKIEGINIAEFVLELVTKFDINNSNYLIKSPDDINPNAQIPQIKHYCDTIKHIHPINPAFPCYFPPFIKTNKFDNLIDQIIPENCIKTTDKSYSSILSSNKMSKNEKQINKSVTTITFNNIYPGFILGDNNQLIPTPTFIFAGRKHQFSKYHKDISRSYMNISIPRCNICRRPGTTYTNCQRCKNEMDKLRNEIKAKGKIEKWTVKLINKKIGDTKIPSVCNKCSQVGHKWVSCNHRPYCYLCALSHNVGDIRYCLVMQAIYIILENVWLIFKSGGNTKEFSNWQLLTYAPSINTQETHIPASLRRDIPLLLKEPNINNTKNKNTNKNKITSINININNKKTDTENELYENTLPGSLFSKQVHPSLSEFDIPAVAVDSDDEVINDMVITPKSNIDNPHPPITVSNNSNRTDDRPHPRRSRRQRPRPKPQPPSNRNIRGNQTRESSPSNTSRSRSRSKKKKMNQK